MSSNRTARDDPSDRRDPPGRNTAALAGFLSYLLEGSLTLLAPSLRELAALSPTPTEAELPAEHVNPCAYWAPRSSTACGDWLAA
jgi:hypothetical protein